MHCVLCEWHLWDTAPSFTWMVPLGAWATGQNARHYHYCPQKFNGHSHLHDHHLASKPSLIGLVVWAPKSNGTNQRASILRFHPQVGWDINNGSVGGSPEWYAMAQDSSPFPEWVPPPSSPLLCWLLAFQSYPFSGQSPAASESPHLLPPTATECQRASLKVQELSSGFTSQRALPQSWVRSHPCSCPAPSYHVLFGLQLEHSFKFIWENHLANKTEKFEFLWKTMHCL